MAKQKSEFRWWLNTISIGFPCLLEITHVDGVAVVNGDTPPDIKEDSTVTVDRAICMQQAGGGKVYIVDIRPNLGMVLASEDPTNRASRRPIYFKAKGLFEGPYIWLDYNSETEAQLHELAYSIYTPQDQKLVVPASSPLDLSGTMPKSFTGGAKDVLNMFNKGRK